MSRSRIYPIYVTGSGCRCDGDVCPCHASCCHAYIRAAVSHQIQRRVTRSGTRPTSTNTLHLHLTSSGWGERERGEIGLSCYLSIENEIHYQGLTHCKEVYLDITTRRLRPPRSLKVSG